jgi:Ca2+-binding RTX toxin-like protein
MDTMSGVIRILLSLCLLANSLPWPAAPAIAAPLAVDSDALAIVSGLKSFAGRVDELGAFDELGQAIPLTALSPGADEALNLDNLFGKVFNALPAAPTLDTLTGDLDGLDGTYDGVSVTVSNVAVDQSGDLVDVSFSLAAMRAVDEPIAFSQDAVNLAGGGISLSLTLSSTLNFQLNRTETNPSLAFYLVGEPTINVGVDAGAAIPSFTSRIGFTEISASGSALLNIDIAVNFADPDDDGRITVDEWTNTALDDLVDVAFVDSPGGAVSATLNLDSNLIPGSPDGTITLVDDDLTNGLSDPSVSLGALEDFTNVNSAQVFGGLTQLAAALIAAHNVSDLEFPFLQDRLGDGFSFADPLIEFLQQQGDAAILCGATSTDPPTGDVSNLPGGKEFFCQAVALQNPASVTWSITNGMILGNATELATVGINPTANVKFTLTSAGSPQVQVQFSDPDGTPHTVVSRFQTAQELFQKLVSLGGFDADPTNLHYDPDASSLTYRLVITRDVAPITGTLNFGSQISSTTGLVGLSPTGNAAVRIDPQDVGLDITFGVILVDDENKIDPSEAISRTVSDRFFFKVRNGPGEHEFKASATVTTSVKLAGRLGFLEVAAEGAPDDTGFIRPADDARPMLAVDIINTPGVTIAAASGTRVIPDAIRVSQLISTPLTYVGAACNAKMSSSITVTTPEIQMADAAGGLAPLQGGVDIRWPDVFGDDCVPDTDSLQVTPNISFTDSLKVFDVDPTNSQALLSVILDGLDALADRIDNLSDTGISATLDAKLPLIGLSPRDLLTQFDDVKAALDKIRTGATDGVPDSLQKLEGVIESNLGIPPSALSFEVRDLPKAGEMSGDGTSDLVVRLSYGICTLNNGPTVVCDPSDKLVEKKDIRLNLDLRDVGDLVGLDASSSLQLEYAARAQLDIGIPLSTAVTPDDIVVLNTSGVSLTAGITTTTASLMATIGPVQVTATGAAALGASFTLRNTAQETFDLDGFVSGLTAVLHRPATPNDCGTANDTPLVGDVCARLSLNLLVGSTTTPLGEFGYVMPDVRQRQVFTATIPPTLTTQIADALLDWTLLLNALPELLDDLRQALDGAASDVKLPLIGDSLDAGADVVNTIEENIVRPLATLGQELNDFITPPGSSMEGLTTPRADLSGEALGLPTVGALRTKIQESIFTKIEPSGLLLDGDDTDSDPDPEDIEVTIQCGSDPQCDSDLTVDNIQDVQITFAIGQGGVPQKGCSNDCEPGKDLRFDIGLPGLPLTSEGAISTRAGWRVLLDFGLNRSDGPYLVVDHGRDAEVSVGASASLAGAPDACRDDRAPDAPGGLDGDLWSNQRCLSGTLGFLEVTLRDGEGDPNDSNPVNDPTNLSLLTQVDLKSSQADGRLTFAELASGLAEFDLSLDAVANVDLRFRTGLTDGADFPSILGTFHLTWAWTLDDDPAATVPAELRFADLHLDAGSFTNRFLEPVVRQIKDVTSPLKPVFDTVRAPLPVLSDLSELTGGPPITLLELLRRATGSDLSMLDSIIAFLDFVSDLPSGGGLIPLGTSPGSFDVEKILAKKGPLTPDQAGQLVTNPRNRSDVLDEICRQTEADAEGCADKEAALGVPGLSFPFLNDSLNIFKVLMGQDVVLVRYDPGDMSATAGIPREFREFFVPTPLGIPIAVALGGSATLKGRFAMGYDTSGLRKVLGGASARGLLDGIFIDDLDGRGKDVPEISLIGTVKAEAGPDLFVVSPRVNGGIDLSVGMNLNDSPEPDGRLRINEIVDRLDNPICLFDVEGKLSAFLSASIRIGFSFFSKTFRKNIARVTLLDFTADLCEPKKPNLANPEDKNGDGKKDLVLNMGLHANRRGVAELEDNEKFVVRQLNPEGTRFSISAFGVYEEESIEAGGIVWASGDNSRGKKENIGDDEISLEPGVDSDSNPVTFTVTAVISGGLGNDQIRGGTGNDRIGGGDGDDKVSGGGGNDILYGDSGDDVLDGEAGNDTIFGGAGNDVITGGPGVDVLNGDAGDDEIDGGPGTNSLTAGPGPNPDLSDTITGGPGKDTIDGNFGDDRLFGDEQYVAGEEQLTCQADGVTPGPNADLVTGGPGADLLFGGLGNDVLAGEQGADILCGNGGDDTLDGDDESVETDDGDDTLSGGSGADKLHGRGGHDTLKGDGENDTLFGGDGSDDLFGGDGRDVLRGQAGNDILLGDIGSIGAHQAAAHDGTVESVTKLVDPSSVAAMGMIDCNDVGTEGGNADCLFGGDGRDFLFGEGGHDKLFGDVGEDYLEGNAGDDEMRGGREADTVLGNAGKDVMHGDSGNDRMFGNEDDDMMRGGIGDDYMEGNEDTDTMSGDAGQDDMIGGTPAAGALDALDIMHGNAGHDVMVGDNASIVRPVDGAGQWITDTFSADAAGVVRRTITLFDVATTTFAPAAGSSGRDRMFGESGYDILYGQGDGDFMSGGPNDDYLEGNAGGDEMHGDAGSDDMVGGTGRINDDPASGVNGRLDAVDRIFGESGFDVMAGDNALLARVLVDGRWQRNTFNGGVQHVPRILLDVDSPDAAIVTGGDRMQGGGDDDLMYGQGGSDDLRGDAGDDFMEGNAAGDEMRGGDGQDDLIGGTVQTGLTDEDDDMFGDDGADVMLGDNGTISRPLDGRGLWMIDVNVGDVIRNMTLYEVEAVGGSPVNPATHGGDEMHGGGDNDFMFGQGDNDEMHGGDDFDYMEGNHAGDTMFGDGGEDDMIGGGSANDGVIDADRVGNGLLDAVDTMYGDDGDGDPATGNDDGDVMAGDNALITRLTGSNGLWQIDPNVNDVVRRVQLFDVEVAGGAAIDPATSGSDVMRGEGGRDFMFGQGNDGSDPDGDGRFDEDPPEGVDNDRDGRESDVSLGYDCQDGADNDDDGFTDAADPQCATRIDEDGGGDELHGGDGDDVMEGNHGSDWMFGDAGQDDMIGGSSAGPDGLVGTGVHPTGLLDGDDVMRGGADADVMLADNGIIQRPVGADRLWLRLVGFGFDVVVRATTMAQVPEAGGAFGDDYMLGDAGHDDMYGQHGDDYMEGNAGQDAMLGDLGLITNSLEDGSRGEFIEPREPFIFDTIFEAGTLYRLAQLYAFQTGNGVEGNDIMLGGDGNDSLHGGAGSDLMNGDGDGNPLTGDPDPATVDEDHLFGDDGNDAMWGGRGHDHLWGGFGNDYLDVRPRPQRTTGQGSKRTVLPADPPEWFIYGEPDNYQAIDYMYGGWNQDAMQANVADTGPVPGDRLIDWVGAYNVYYLCPGLYGEWVITRGHSPHIIQFLQQLAEGDGAFSPATAGSSGFRELALVFPNDARFNSNPPHPDNPGHFTCTGG